MGFYSRLIRRLPVREACHGLGRVARRVWSGWRRRRRRMAMYMDNGKRGRVIFRIVCSGRAGG